MRRIIFSLLLICSTGALANIRDEITQMDVSPLEVSQMFDEQNSIILAELPDLLDQQEKVDRCMDAYVKKQSKSYAKIAQNNLYDLIHNFDRIVSKINGKTPGMDDIPYEEKVEALARIQCEAYYTMGVLK